MTRTGSLAFIAGTAIAALLASTAADAATVTIDSLTGAWSNSVGGSGTVTTANNGTPNPEIRWGTPAGGT